MEKYQNMLLWALSAHLKQVNIETIPTTEEWTSCQDMSVEEWLLFLDKANEQNILPMVYDAVYRMESFQQLPEEIKQQCKSMVNTLVFGQVQKTSYFLGLYRYLKKRDIHPRVIKGIICRNLYPQPDYRISGDEDVWINVADYVKCRDLLLEYGMQFASDVDDMLQEHEVSFGSARNQFLLEVHKTLFPQSSDAYGDFNGLFMASYEQALEMEVDGVKIMSLNHTDHLMYLICHAFKHFVHSGFGLRQVCDIVIYASAYGDQIDWNDIRRKSRTVNAAEFLCAILKVGMKQLHRKELQSVLPTEWQQEIEQTDELPLLMDLLSGGIYGATDLTRQHSSTITVNAVAANKNGKDASVMRSAFPKAKDIEGRYPYLVKKPYLLPIAWVDRIFHYHKELGKLSDELDTMKSVEIGKERVELLRKYHIIE